MQRGGTPSERAERRPAGELLRGQPGSTRRRGNHRQRRRQQLQLACSSNCGSACRMASQFQANYVFGKEYISERLSFRTPRKKVGTWATSGGVAHAFKTNWVYELPFGQGRRFFSGVNGFVDRLIGGWAFDGIATIQCGRQLGFGNVRLVGMSAGELRARPSSCGSTMPGGSLHAPAGHHRQHRRGVQRQRHVRSPATAAWSPDRALHRAGERPGLYRDRPDGGRQRVRRLRRRQPRHDWTAARCGSTSAR